MKSKSHYIRALLVTAVCIMAASCGFQPRGSYNLPEEIQAISVTSFDQYGMITRDVKTQLRYHGITVASKPEQNIANLHLRNETFSEKTLSLYQNSRIAQEQFTYTVNYSVTIPNQGSYEFSTSANRTYLDNALTALAKSVEVGMLYQEMRIESAKQIMRQLARLNPHIEEFQRDQYHRSATEQTFTEKKTPEIITEVRTQSEKTDNQTELNDSDAK